MSPNDVELVRVYTKEIGGKISDTTLPVSSGFEVIVEAEAGSAIHSSGAQFLMNILVRDLSANDIIPATPIDVGYAWRLPLCSLLSKREKG